MFPSICYRPNAGHACEIAICPVCNEVVERDHLIHGYEVEKGRYVQFTAAELDTIEAEANSNIELREFIPIEKIDPVYFAGVHYMAPDQGGEKAYRLLADAMEKSGRVALAEMVSHGKERLVLIRPRDGGLLLQVMFYANEIRDFDQVPRAENVRLAGKELELGRGLVDKLSSENFEPQAYDDEYRNRVLALIDEKAKGGRLLFRQK